jgi:hypothetical protein
LIATYPIPILFLIVHKIDLLVPGDGSSSSLVTGKAINEKQNNYISTEIEKTQCYNQPLTLKTHLSLTANIMVEMREGGCLEQGGGGWIGAGRGKGGAAAAVKI